MSIFKKTIFSFLSVLIVGAGFFSYQPVQAGLGGINPCILFPQLCGASQITIDKFYALKDTSDVYGQDKTSTPPATPAFGNSPFKVNFELDLKNYVSTKAYTVYVYCNVVTPVPTTGTLPATVTVANITPTANNKAGFTESIPVGSDTAAKDFVYKTTGTCNYTASANSDYVSTPTPPHHTFSPQIILVNPLTTQTSTITVNTIQDTLAIDYDSSALPSGNYYSSDKFTYKVNPLIYTLSPLANTDSIFRTVIGGANTKITYNNLTKADSTNCGTPTSDSGSSSLISTVPALSITPPYQPAPVQYNSQLAVNCQYFNNSTSNNTNDLGITFKGMNVTGYVQNSSQNPSSKTKSSPGITILPNLISASVDSGSSAGGPVFTNIALIFDVNSTSGPVNQLSYILDCNNGTATHGTSSNHELYNGASLPRGNTPKTILTFNGSTTSTNNTGCTYLGDLNATSTQYTPTLTVFRGNVSSNIYTTITVTPPRFSADVNFSDTNTKSSTGDSFATPTFILKVPDPNSTTDTTDDYFGVTGSTRTYTVYCDDGGPAQSGATFNLTTKTGTANYNGCKYLNYTSIPLTYHPKIQMTEKFTNGTITYTKTSTSNLTYKVNPFSGSGSIFNYGAGNREF